MIATLLPLIAGFGFVQTMSPPQTQTQPNDLPPPSGFNQVWSIDAGNGRLSLSITWENGGIHKVADYFCWKACRGKVHLLHSQCDDTCDRGCPEIHKFDLEPHFEALVETGELTQIDQITKDFAKFGSGNYTGSAPEYAMRQAIQAAVDKDKAKWTAHINWQHWFTGNCGGQVRNLKGHEYVGFLHYNMYREVPGPDGKLIHTTGPQGSIKLFRFRVYLDQFVPEKAYQECRCSVVTDEPEEHGYVPPPPSADTGVCQVTPQGNVQMSTKALEALNFNVSCQNMGLALVTAENPTDKPMTIILEPGTVLRSDDPKFQDMLIIALVKMVLPPKQLYASIANDWLNPFGKVTGRARIACINMNKRQPEPSVKYTVDLPDNLGWVRVAQLQAKLRTEEPYDQARLWIYSDKASFETVSTKLFPAPTKGQYARALYQLGNDCDIDLSGDEYKGCFDPLLLSGTDMPLNTVQWVVRETAKRDPAGLAKWIESGSQSFADGFAKAGVAEIKFYAALANGLATHSDPVVKKSAVTFVMKVLTPEIRAKVTEAGGLNGILSGLLWNDSDLASSALDVYEACHPTDGEVFLRNVNKELPEEVRNRAASLVKGS